MPQPAATPTAAASAKPAAPAPPRPRKPPPSEEELAAARAAHQRGNTLLFGGDTAGAISAYRDALRADPGHAPSVRGLGLAYAQQGDRKNAIASFERYLKLAPKAADKALIQKRIADLKNR
jgi:eukaryotic-like serine/threonine-protein kinase